MSKEQEVFFELVRSGLWGSHSPVSSSSTSEATKSSAKFQVSSNIDWEKVYTLATEQSVVGLLAVGIDSLNPNVPLELKLNIIGEALQLEQQNKAMNSFLGKLIEGLRKEDVYTLLVKGQGIAQCYEKPLWRSCGDIDLFLSADNFAKAQKALLPKASSVEDVYAYTKHQGMTIDEWVVELHGSLRFGLSSRMDKVLDGIQYDTFYQGDVRSWLNGNTQVFLLSPINDAVYVFAHFLNHFYREGLGVRQICDWCRLLYTYREKLDLRLLEQRIKQMGLLMEWRAFGAFAVEYLGMPIEAMPLLNENDNQNANLKRKAERIKDFILMSGNFGHNRDMSHFGKYPFFVRKCISMGRRVGDIFNHAKIFPMSSLRFFPRIMWNGVVSAMKGEG